MPEKSYGCIAKCAYFARAITPTMKNQYTRLCTALFLLIALGTACKKDNTTTPAETMDQRYSIAIKDAMVADSSEITDTLWALTAANQHLQWKTVHGQQYVLMATFMRFPGSYPAGDSINTTWGDGWLFIPSQMKSRLLPGFTATSDTIMRISQLLGLPPVNSKSNTNIATIWVPTSRLFRPAGNPDITTSTASAVLANGLPDDYVTWFNNYIIYAYYHTLQSSTDFHYPWTRMGYTYDWAPGASKVGLSEYVLKANTGCWVEQTSSAADFFKQ